ncbi:MAG TPA: ribosome small subunit-dependent GTPase A, partial [Lachnospiraceae bacterium]|nr:ribosome small subunit-dependent GTPase A [Lachnospiraceae bacterium]
TTRHSELFYLDKGTYLMDTPGFTAFSLMDMPENTIKNYYPEFYPYEGKCKYQECSHIHEPKCAVKDAVQTGAISRIRYEGYLTIYEEQKNRRKY